MDKYRHTDDSQEMDDVSRLILELKDLSTDLQDNDQIQMPAKNKQKSAPAPEETVVQPVKVKNRKTLPIWLVALIDILVGGAVILTFAFFHHVLPAINSAKAREEALLHATEPQIVVTAPATEAPATEVPATSPETTPPPATEPAPDPDATE